MCKMSGSLKMRQIDACPCGQFGAGKCCEAMTAKARQASFLTLCFFTLGRITHLARPSVRLSTIGS